MKYIKIGIAVLVLAGIVFFTVKSVDFTSNTTDKIEISKPENQFMQRIEQEIAKLDSVSGLQESGKHYQKVVYLIGDFKQNKKFDSIPETNQQWAESFQKKTYALYVDKFIQESFKIFKGSEWGYKDLQFIRKEIGSLQKSSFLEKNSSANESLAKIQRVLNSYSEIASFVSQCKRFRYLSDRLEDKFPLDEVRQKLLKVKEYQSRGGYVKNCTRLRKQLNAVPQVLFNAHIAYLDNKIDNWSNLYMQYNTQRDYSEKLYFPIMKEVYSLSRAVYTFVPNFDKEYERLKDKWKADNRKAYNHQYPN